jgi:hypothetical protein
LVLNPSFESYTACPIAMGVEINKVIGWDSSRASPDYFNSCSSVSYVQTPRNFFGYQKPASGNAYCGFWSYDPSAFYREVLIGQLSSSLTINQKYFVSFKVSRGDSNFVTGYSCNKLGAKFTKVKQGNVSINNSSHYYTNLVITDTLGWTKLFGGFIADSAYKYIMIGNFFDDSNIITNNDFSGSGAYYYIDDVCLSTDSTFAYNYVTNVQDITNELNNLFIYPNPASEVIIASWIINDLKVFDVHGKEYKYSHKIKNFETHIDCSNWPNGIYFLKNDNNNHKIIINH